MAPATSIDTMMEAVESSAEENPSKNDFFNTS